MSAAEALLSLGDKHKDFHEKYATNTDHQKVNQENESKITKTSQIDEASVGETL